MMWLRHHWLKSQSLGLIPELYPVFRLPLISASGSSQVKYVNTTFLPEILSRLTEKRKVICMHPHVHCYLPCRAVEREEIYVEV